MIALVRAGGFGGIRPDAEAELLGRDADALAADVLLVPHHGSRTSSSEAFLAAVHPVLAVVPAGYRNRFGHPNAEVMERYSRAIIPVFRTDRDGAVTVSLSGNTLDSWGERQRRRRYWHDAPT